MRRRLLAAALLAAAAGAPAETVYRCGPDGSRYASEPCTDGRAVQAQDARTVAQREQAEAAAQREAALARRLAHERERREAAIKPALAVGIRGERGVAPTRPASAPAKGKKNKSTKTKKAAAQGADAAVSPR